MWVTLSGCSTIPRPPITSGLVPFGSEPLGISVGVTVTVTTCPGESDEPGGATETAGADGVRKYVQVLVTLDGFVIVNVCEEVGAVPHVVAGRLMS